MKKAMALTFYIKKALYFNFFALQKLLKDNPEGTTVRNCL